MNFRFIVEKSFRRVKEDIMELKATINEWFSYFDANQKRVELKIELLERRLEKLESKKIEL